MSIIRFIFCLFFLLDAYWWRVADRKLRNLHRARGWRGLLAVFMIGQATLLLSRLMPPSWSRQINGHVPLALIAGQYLWHLGVLPFWILGGFMLRGVAQVTRLKSHRRKSHTVDLSNDPSRFREDPTTPPVPDVRVPQVAVLRDLCPSTGEDTGLRIRRPVAPIDPHHECGRSTTNPSPLHLTRRQMLSAAAVAVPPLLMGGLAGVALAQLGRYRVRAFDLFIPDLPAKLEGVTIAHLSDFHAGRFMTRRNMAPIIDTVNDMKPDLVLITGDLIDYALIDLPPALEALKRLKPKYGLRDGLAMCMGNHDIIENRFDFKREAEAAGFPILANAARYVEVNGCPIQLMAIDWCNGDRTTKAADMTRAAVQSIAQLRDPAAFPILMAHHPHAFDEAAKARLPLTLSGHTHGGQIMVTPNFGAGSTMFRYWSGLYRKPNGSQLIVSNGIGNWFPLRVNAPAEVLRLTLRSG